MPPALKGRTARPYSKFQRCREKCPRHFVKVVLDENYTGLIIVMRLGLEMGKMLIETIKSK